MQTVNTTSMLMQTHNLYIMHVYSIKLLKSFHLLPEMHAPWQNRIIYTHTHKKKQRAHIKVSFWRKYYKESSHGAVVFTLYFIYVIQTLNKSARFVQFKVFTPGKYVYLNVICGIHSWDSTEFFFFFFWTHTKKELCLTNHWLQI